VADKVGEADYFLDLMKARLGHFKEFEYLLSAFLSAARSITFSLQAVMNKYPDFPEWYLLRQEKLKKNDLARFFVDLRNHVIKVGTVPVYQSGAWDRSGQVLSDAEFVPIPEITEVPAGSVVVLAEQYLIDILDVLKECYEDYGTYVDPRKLFTKEGLAELNWSIEDLEEALGFPRGWTKIEFEREDLEAARIDALSRYGGDEDMEQYFAKYEIGSAKGE